MKNMLSAGKLSKPFQALAIAASGVMAATGIQAKPSDTIVLVPPKDLPELSRHSGVGMLLHEAIDGRTVLYVEQIQGSGLATFDVTDPSHIKAEGTVDLHAGPFDFVSALGDRAELIRFRQGHEEAVLDLHKEALPKLKPLHTAQGAVMPLGNDAETVTSQAKEQELDRDYQVIETANSHYPNRVFEVKQVRAEMTNAATGTTFLLTENGLYLVRRPNVEWTHQLMAITPN
jgi:hypothetical protein